jgi:hypothetical protein
MAAPVQSYCFTVRTDLIGPAMLNGALPKLDANAGCSFCTRDVLFCSPRGAHLRGPTQFLGTMKRGKNSTNYIRHQEMVEEKVFDTIKKYGGTAMQVLLEKVRIGHPNSQGDVEGYRFSSGDELTVWSARKLERHFEDHHDGHLRRTKKALHDPPLAFPHSDGFATGIRL